MLKVFPCSTTHCLLSFMGTTLAEDLQAASKIAGGRRRQRWFWPTSRVSEEPKSYKLFLAHLSTGAPQPVGLNPRSSSFALSVARVRCRELRLWGEGTVRHERRCFKAEVQPAPQVSNHFIMPGLNWFGNPLSLMVPLKFQMISKW